MMNEKSVRLVKWAKQNKNKKKLFSRIKPKMIVSIDDETVPTDWKTATVTPIFKKGTRTEPGNYRPVSLTCVTCKILESL